MKKSKLLIVGLIALLLAGGLVLASCAPKCSAGNCGREQSACSSVCRGSGGILGMLNCGDACTTSSSD